MTSDWSYSAYKSLRSLPTYSMMKLSCPPSRSWPAKPERWVCSGASEGWKWVPNSLGMRLGNDAQFLVLCFSCWWKDNSRLLCLPSSLQSKQVDKLVQLLTSERSKVKKGTTIQCKFSTSGHFGNLRNYIHCTDPSVISILPPGQGPCPVWQAEECLPGSNQVEIGEWSQKHIWDCREGRTVTG